LAVPLEGGSETARQILNGSGKMHFEKRRVSDNTVRMEDKIKLDSFLYKDMTGKGKDKSAKASQNTSVINNGPQQTAPQTTTNASSKKHVAMGYFTNGNTSSTQQ
jgi:4-amino-4-deoxy-L-arabinose transferase-like glycosyltransferase